MSAELIEQLRAVFFEESDEALDHFETGLIQIDEGSRDPDLINSVFRAAHSIKGGCGTFGFADIGHFTHGIESYLDEVRSGAEILTSESITLLLKAVDHLRSMLDAARQGDSVDAGETERLAAALAALLTDGPVNAEPVKERPAEADRWRVEFIPHLGLMQTGNDPVLLLRELTTLADVSIHVDDARIPAFADLDPTELHLSWTLELRGPVTADAIEEVFAWVDDECALKITAIDEEVAATRSDPPEAPTAATPTPTLAAKSSNRGTTEASSIRVSIEKVDALINIVGELVITQSMLGQIGKDFDMTRLERLRDGLVQLERNTRELQENVMRIRMLPVSFAFNRIPRIVRDLSRELGKQVELQMSGEGTELDKTVLEKVGDPFVHLVRNAIDHGIETPDERRAAGKPEAAVVGLNAYHQGGNIIIEISDDGRGLNTEKILAKARAMGLVDGAETPSEEAIHQLIFAPGFSTAAEVSDVSGRGVGMDVVRRNIKELGGSVDVESRRGQGATFRIRLPLTLAILDGQLIQVHDQTYIIPLVSIVESLQARKELVSCIAGRTELYRLRDEYIPILRLHEVLGVTGEREPLDGRLLVVVEGDGRRAALLVDDLLNQQQVVIKSLETNYQRVDGASGATILGDGRVALILDVTGLIESSHKSPSGPARNSPDGTIHLAA